MRFPRRGPRLGPEHRALAIVRNMTGTAYPSLRHALTGSIGFRLGGNPHIVIRPFNHELVGMAGCTKTFLAKERLPEETVHSVSLGIDSLPLYITSGLPLMGIMAGMTLHQGAAVRMGIQGERDGAGHLPGQGRGRALRQVAGGGREDASDGARH